MSNFIKWGVYFRILEGARVAEDEDGNPTDAYASIMMEVTEVPSEEKEELVRGAYKKLLAAQFDCDEELVVNISRMEYEESNDEESDEEKTPARVNTREMRDAYDEECFEEYIDALENGEDWGDSI
jgi:hypothetical protein